MMRYDPGRRQYLELFDSICDTINNLTIKTKHMTGSPFNQTVIIISTADKGIDTLVRKAAQTAGYSPDIMNTDVIPSSTVNMGLEGNVDLLGFVSRVAVPRDRNELDAYVKGPGSIVLRLTPKVTVTPDPFPVPALRVRGTGKTELDFLPAVEELRRAILSRYGNLNAAEMPTYVAFPAGSTLYRAR